MTEFCVDSTCRGAVARDYKVILAEDGHSTWDNKILPARKSR